MTLALFEPVVASLLAAGALGEAVGASAWGGLALVLVGVLVVVRGELSASTVMEPSPPPYRRANSGMPKRLRYAPGPMPVVRLNKRRKNAASS